LQFFFRIIDVQNCDNPGSLSRLITGSYVVGRNTIRIRSREELDPDQQDEIHNTVKRLTGLTIVNQGPRFITIENFAEPTRFPIDGLLRRLHYLTSRMQKLTLDCIIETKNENAMEIERLEEEANRLYWLVVRQLFLAAKDRTIASNIGETDSLRIIDDRVIAAELEDVGDLWRDISREFAELGEGQYKSTKEFQKVLQTLKTLLEEQTESTMNAFFSRDWVLANNSLEIHHKVLETIKELETIVPSSRPAKQHSFCSVCTSIRSILTPIAQISRHYAAISHMTINRALQAMEGVIPAK